MAWSIHSKLIIEHTHLFRFTIGEKHVGSS